MIQNPIRWVRETHPSLAPWIECAATLVGDEREYGETDGVVTYAPARSSLMLHHYAWAGYGAFDTGAYAEAGVPLTNSSGIHGATVGEVAIGCMLSLARLLHVYHNHQTETH